MTAPEPAEPDPPRAELVPCGWCRGPIVDTPVGWMHLDQYRSLDGWLCPPPHLHIAQPRPEVTPEPTAPRRRRPTPIPSIKDDGAPPREWPPPAPDAAWWEGQP